MREFLLQTTKSINRQSDLFPVAIPLEAYSYGQRSDGGTHGVVLTKTHIVDLILNLAGYTDDRNLASLRLLEPSCGHGAFLVPAVERLLQTYCHSDRPHGSLKNAITAFDIDPQHVAITKQRLLSLLRDHNFNSSESERLVDAWVHQGDTLLADLEADYDVVVGNPPYVRIEQIAPVLQTEYRKRFKSIYDRADLYVAFIEKCLSLLRPSGVLSFICADRWTLNKYGAPLREIVSEKYQVRVYVDLHTSSPFESEVSAYPSIFVFAPGKTEGVNVFKLVSGTPEECSSVYEFLQGKGGTRSPTPHAFYQKWFDGQDPWTLASPEHVQALRQLEGQHDLIESHGNTKVRIGVATGCDNLYLINDPAKIEDSRLLPLVMREDLHEGRINDAGRFVINTFEDNGKIVELSSYPKLKNYLTTHAQDILRRHVAKKNASGWYRTIDRVHPELVKLPKLLIPDIAGANEVTFDSGNYYPHHNLYFITSDVWDLEVLGGLLSSRVALFFVWSYAVKMRGGYLRFQAQYLRRIRVPNVLSLSSKLKRDLRLAFQKRDFGWIDELALKAYNLQALPSFDFVDTRA